MSTSGELPAITLRKNCSIGKAPRTPLAIGLPAPKKSGLKASRAAKKSDALPCARMRSRARRQCLGDLRVIQVRGLAVGADDVHAVDLGPQRQEFRELGIEPEAGDLAAALLQHLLVGRLEGVPVAHVERRRINAGLARDLVVDDDDGDVEELRDAVDLVLELDGLDRRVAEVRHLDPGLRDAVVHRLDRALRREAADLAPVHVDQIGRVAAPDGREELLVIEPTLGAVESHLGVLLLELGDAARRDVIALRAVEAHHVEGAARVDRDR